MSSDEKGKLVVTMNGPIGETTPLFSLPLKGLKEITLEMSGVTYISSVGVKNWIVWTLKIPANCKVSIVSCPYVIVSQASTVTGFLTHHMIIESFRAPYVCESCGFEGVHTLTKGVEYSYSTATTPMKFSVPDNLTCPKCRKLNFNHDILIDRTFKFLS